MNEYLVEVQIKVFIPVKGNSEVAAKVAMFQKLKALFPGSTIEAKVLQVAKVE